MVRLLKGPNFTAQYTSDTGAFVIKVTEWNGRAGAGPDAGKVKAAREEGGDVRRCCRWAGALTAAFPTHNPTHNSCGLVRLTLRLAVPACL